VEVKVEKEGKGGGGGGGGGGELGVKGLTSPRVQIFSKPIRKA